MKTTEQFIADAVAVHGDKYDYSKVEYTGNNNKVIITCLDHGDWAMTPSNHLRGQNCPECGKRIGIEKLTIFKRNSAQELLKRKFEGLIQPEEYKLIPLTQGKFAMVDNDDFEYLSQFNWCYKEGYAENRSLGMMHRVILKVTDPKVFVDHRKHNTLDNRKSELRLCDIRKNRRNSKPYKNSTSVYKGVSWAKHVDKWVAQLTHVGKNYHLGLFDDEIECAKVYDRKAIELHGEFARLNFPELREQYLKELK